ncbi:MULTISPECIES: cytochrome o ubiquinol oxidase subunit IV [Paraburkholderia]|jgi:cytochrome o ubiquinol oxidase operon protein cyoD|uniref:Cytochrome bo(3) ubiquinol oxidase subunit 4 n=2 Tax=Paraburkholderia TaxID=1822464 RepID=A0AAW3US18_9BURK|nr:MULTISPECIES: cytochrome o ubiquinol oxidase subunit IV [Paraburkholderia]MBB4513145.1 cytochrome o ubiquinol oxidase operon protein cyoD [Paraburkholderia fungorum]MBB6201429.1 cytochrome o ubiquinol oxidase operon protein cyoD [Paraburkholderia fungorum]
MAHTRSLHEEEGHGSLSGYIVGFVLAVVLTAASFGLVMNGMLEARSAMVVLAVLALVQIVVHLVFFLHLNTSSGQRWNVMALCYTAVAAIILIGGTVWVMHNVSMNMMSR